MYFSLRGSSHFNGAVISCAIEAHTLVHTKFHFCWLEDRSSLDSIFASYVFHQRLMHNLRGSVGKYNSLSISL